MDAAFKLRFDRVETDSFLGVTRSLKGVPWRERLRPEEARLCAAICQSALTRRQAPLIGMEFPAPSGSTKSSTPCSAGRRPVATVVHNSGDK